MDQMEQWDARRAPEERGGGGCTYDVALGPGTEPVDLFCPPPARTFGDLSGNCFWIISKKEMAAAPCWACGVPLRVSSHLETTEISELYQPR